MNDAVECACYVLQETAAAVVWALAFEQECRAAIVAAGGIHSLIRLCATSGSTAVLEHAAGALWNLTYDEASRSAVASAGGIPPLVALLQHGSVEVQQHAAGALANLAVDGTLLPTIADTAGVSLLVQLLGSSSTQIVEFAIDIVQDRLSAAAAAAPGSADAEFSKALAVAGGILALVRLLSIQDDGHAGTDLTMRLRAAACLASLATDPVYAKATAEPHGAILALVKLAGSSSSLEEQEEAATILGLIAAADDDCRRAICHANGAAALVGLLSSSSHAVVANTAAAVSNLASDADCRQALAEVGGIQSLLSLLSQVQLWQQQQQQQQQQIVEQQPQPADVDGFTIGDACACAAPAASIADRPSLSLMSGAQSVADSLVSQPDSWLCPMTSVAPLVNNASVVVDV
uniref:Vacuolar protein 8 n=1 Tax=Tetradesmus obliquus TaxID=3088 RepID=A0A383WP63_TETOB|eukprot:jgi/Sobl393_1/13835/SZX78954.1